MPTELDIPSLDPTALDERGVLRARAPVEPASGHRRLRGLRGKGLLRHGPDLLRPRTRMRKLTS